MALRVPCPGCGVLLGLAENAAGARARCPKCTHVFVVPAAAPPTPAAAIKPAAPAPPAPAVPPPAAPVDDNPFSFTASDRPFAHTKETPRKPAPAPAPRRPETARPKGKTTRPWLIPVIGVGGILAMGGVIALAFFMLRDNPVARIAGEQSVKKASGKAPAVRPKPQDDDPQPIPEPIVSLSREDAKADPVTADGTLTAAMVQKVKEATVHIGVTAVDGQSFSGSGFLAFGRGFVLTNAHVIDMKDPQSTAPEQIAVTLWNGEPNEKRLSAEVVGVDREADLALSRFIQNGEFEETKMPPHLPIVPSKTLQLTQRVFIIGFPFGNSIGKNATVSASSISSLRNNVAGELDEVQVNGGIHPGNSGGPVVDAAGRVVGVCVSGIRNTQIQFAIPCEKVFDFVAGRVLSAKAGEAAPSSGSFGVPIALKVADPLKNIQKVELEWWQGKPGAGRPASLTRPAPAAGDGERRKLAAIYDTDTATGLVNLTLPALPAAGQMLWVQPVLYGKDGKPSWGTATAQVVRPVPDPKPALLARKAGPEKQFVRLTVRSTLHDRSATVLSTADTHMVEEAKEKAADAPQDQHIAFTRGEHDVALNGKPWPVDASRSRALAELNHAGIDLKVDAQGNLVKSAVDLKGVAADQKKTLDKYLEHVRTSLEILAIPLPGGATSEPGHKWQAVRPVAEGPFDKVYPAKIDMTYSFRGIRKEDDRDVGVLEISGTLKPYTSKEFKGRELVGTASGEAIIDLETGQSLRVHCTLNLAQQLQFRNAAITLAHKTVELTLTRGKNAK